jgi:DNA-binding HxlR family transcriptional regulator
VKHDRARFDTTPDDRRPTMTTATADTHSALPGVAVTIMESLYQHRLLTTEQLRVLHTPDATAGWTRRVLRSLSVRGLVDRVRGPATRSLWYLTELGADTIEAAGTLAEPRRRLTTSAQAAGPLRAHTIAVNEVGIAFVRAARERDDECGSDSWRHEIAHPTSRARGRKPAELVVADALLTYLQIGGDGGLILHQRFVELDRGTARPAEQLASKITRYARLRHYAGAPVGRRDAAARAASAFQDAPERPLWRNYYRSFPHLLIVLADQSRERIRTRIQRTLALHESDPTLGGQEAGACERRGASLPVSFVALEDLMTHGPFAPIFLFAEHPDRQVDWLGRQHSNRLKPCPARPAQTCG